MKESTWRCTHGWLRGEQCEICKEATTAIKEALAQGEQSSSQEPVFLIYDDAGGWIESNESEYRKTEEVNRWLLYTTPPKRPWAELTDEEYDEIWRMDLNNKDIMDKTIAKLKEKNT